MRVLYLLNLRVNKKLVINSVGSPISSCFPNIGMHINKTHLIFAVRSDGNGM